MSCNCAQCPAHCCGRNKDIGAPVLLPQEYLKFQLFSIKTFVDGTEFRRIIRGEDGFCIFLDNNSRCSIYDSRPFECRAYPYVIRADRSFILSNNCPDNKSADFPTDVPNIDEAWLKAYDKLPLDKIE